MGAKSDRHQTESSRDWLTILALILPVAVGVLILLIILGMAVPGSPIHLDEPGQLSIVADTTFSVLVLCPLVVCFAPLCLALIVSVYGLHKLNGKAEQTMQQMQGVSQNLPEKTATAADSASRKSIEFNARGMFITRFLNIFEHQRSKGSSDVDE